MRVGLFNDSFPPSVDGVAQTVKNYALTLNKRPDYSVRVVAPRCHGASDKDYPFPVYRYAALPMPRRIGYRAGAPFSPLLLKKLSSQRMDLYHVHCPFASAVLVDELVHLHRAPVIHTYHTKFDIELRVRLRTPAIRAAATQVIRHNLENADEVWAVTESCGQALRQVGYEGEYFVVENGTDFAYGKADADSVQLLRELYEIPEDHFVLLFVGRMMWYKNTRIILDALKIAREKGLPFTTLMVGDGLDAPAIRAYAQQLGLDDVVRFTGLLLDREQLRDFYTIADLFLFPSTYDTSGLVVKEAAACECASVLTRGSCAAEGVTDGVNGFLADENAEDFARAVLAACDNKAALEAVGAHAGETLYLSWDDAVKKAAARYEEVLRKWNG